MIRDETERGTVFDIKRFAVHDGPGIRTSVFLKGCPLHCPWCHNPEGLSPQPQLIFTPEKCIGCGGCVQVCPRGAHRLVNGRHRLDWDRVDPRQCADCGACVEGCYAGALRLAGRRTTVAEVMDEVLRDRPFYESSGGGITLSGGEPLAQEGFCEGLLRAARSEGIHTALNTTGCASWTQVAALLPFLGLVLYDLKHMDRERHIALTGMSNEPILDNLRRLDAAGQAIWIRVPLIPGWNDEASNFHALGQFLSSLKHIQRMEILRYHRLAGSKYGQIGRAYRLHGLPSPSEEHAELRREILLSYGLKHILIRGI